MTLSPAALSLLMQGKQNPRALLSQVAAEMAEDDPQMALFSQVLAMQPDDEAHDHEDTLVDEGNPIAARHWIDDSELIALREDVGSIQIQLADQAQWLQELSDRNNELAAALGACPHCWGEDRGCPECHGRGIPGSRMPERKGFTYYVAGALQRLKTENSRLRRQSDSTSDA